MREAASGGLFGTRLHGVAESYAISPKRMRTPKKGASNAED